MLPYFSLVSYGASCYQKNPVHRKKFAHPGDEDYAAPGAGPAAAAGKRRRGKVSYKGMDDGEPIDDDDDLMEEDDSADDGGRHRGRSSPLDEAPAAKARKLVGRDSRDSSPEPRRLAETAATSAAAVPADATKASPGKQAVQAAGLADIFTGLTVFVSKDDPQQRLLTRYIIGFDGDAVQDASAPLTHVLVPTLDPASWPDDVRAAVSAHAGMVAEEGVRAEGT